MTIHDHTSFEQPQVQRRRELERRNSIKVDTQKLFSAQINRRLKKLAKKDNYHGPLAWVETTSLILIAILFGIYAFGAGPWYTDVLAYIGSCIVIGARQRGLATLVHESSHRCAAKHKRLNHFLGSVASGWWIFQIRETYFLSHVMRHHPYIGDTTNDPDIIQYVEQGLINQNSKYFVINNVIGMVFGLKTLVNFPYLVRDRLFPTNWATASKLHLLELLGFFIFWAVIATALTLTGTWKWFLMFWIVPYFTVFQAINWLIETSEHFPLTWLETSAVRATRNRDGNAFERFFTGIHGEGWHLVHHLRPGIPFWNMRKAHQTMLADDEYRTSTARYGGLFTNSTITRPTILKAMSEELNLIQRSSANPRNEKAKK